MIDILLPTYNGARHLDAQLQSILSQTYSDWRLLIRDDGSTDHTDIIINHYTTEFPEKILLLHDYKNHVGCSKSFELLIASSKAEYIMLSDQDDFWLPNKIEIEVSSLMNLEQIHENSPCMIFTNLTVTDSELRPLGDLWKLQALNPENALNWRTNLALNAVSGCTIIMNRSACRCILPFPSSMNVIHDQWISCCVAKYGYISYLDKSTILYRQHSHNLIGGRQLTTMQLLLRIKNLNKSLSAINAICKRLGLLWDFPLIVIMKIFYNTSRILNLSYRK